MNIPAGMQKPLGVALAVGAGALLVYWFGRRAFDAVADINKGTPYEGAGVIGTLGNVTNAASGGALAEWGSAVGIGAYEYLNSERDALALASTPQEREAVKKAIAAQRAQTAAVLSGTMAGPVYQLWNWWRS